MMGAMLRSPVWGLLRKGGTVLAGVVMPTSNRVDLISWYEGLGHLPGQITDWQEAGGLMVRLRIGDVSTKGTVLVRAELLNPGTRVWRGGLNLTDSPSTDSEAILTIGPSRSADWWSYLPSRTSQIFVRVDPDARANT